MKRILSLALALALCLSLSIPAMAAEKTLYLSQTFDDNLLRTVMKEVSPEEAVFTLTGDLSKKGEAIGEYQDTLIFSSNGPVKVGIQVYNKNYNPRNIAIGSSGGYVSEDHGISCNEIYIYGMKYNAASDEYSIANEDLMYFDGQLEVYAEDGSSSIVSIADYYTKPEITSDGMPILASNATATLSEPGIYLIALSCDGPSGKLLIEVNGPSAPSTPVTTTPKFTDVAANSPYKEAIDWAVKEGITKGITNTTFGPSNTCSISNILTFLWRAAGQPGDSLADWVKSVGIIINITNEPCTRAMAVDFMWRAAGCPKPSKPSSFSDVPVTVFYSQAVAWAVEKGITTGTSAKEFSPDKTCTRGQIVTFLYRASK